MSAKRKYPQWFDGHKVNEILFCEEFRKEHPMICVKGKFFTKDGLVEDEKNLETEIFNAIKFFVTEKVSNVVRSLMDVLKLMCHSEPLPMQTDRVHVANGTYFLDGRYTYKMDDDMKMAALPETSYLKTMVTLEGKMDVEWKGKQGEQRIMYCRFLCFGNGPLTALYDRSFGFHRRQLILSVKDRDANRIDDPYLSDKLEKEAEGIFPWMLEGLNRLIANDYKFTESDRAKNNLQDAMEDSNLHREKILPSEKAFAYKLKMDAMSRQGQRTDLTSRQVVGKLETADLIADNESGRQVLRYIRLTELIPEILKMVDGNKIALTPAVELSYLTRQEQRDLLETMKSEDCTPSLSQVIQLKKLSQAGELNMDKIFDILREPKANQQDKISFRVDDLRIFFPKSYSAARIQETILKLLTDYYRKRQRSREER